MNYTTVIIQAISTSTNYGSIFACVNGAICIFFINGDTVTKIDITDNEITYYASNPYIWITFPTEYTHGFIVVSGQLGFEAKFLAS